MVSDANISRYLYSKYKRKSISLRKKGLSYSEIIRKVPVSQATLSKWLGKINLSEKQIERLKQKSEISRKLGSQANRKKRIDITKIIISQASGEVGKISDRELWLMGTMLYWAEGSKQKKHNVGQRVIFHNSDPLMVKLYTRWILGSINIPRTDVDFEIYSHENIKYKEGEVKRYWSKITGFPINTFGKMYYKKDKKKKYRKNQGEDYYGLLRIIVLKSTNLNRKISGWIRGICNQYGIVQQ